jgi:hypothetical protein
MINWILEAEEVVCPVDDMKKMDMFTLWRDGVGEERTCRVQGGSGRCKPTLHAGICIDGYGIIESRLYREDRSVQYKIKITMTPLH